MPTKSISSLTEILNASLQHHRAGRLGEAAAGYRAILEQNPRHSDALHLLGVIAQQQGQHSLAIELIEAAIAQNSSIAHYHHNLGNTYLQSKHPAEAAECYRRAVQLKPDYYEAHNGLGNALTDLKLMDKAIESYVKAVRLNPSFAEAHYNLGRSLAQAERFQEAIASYLSAIEFDNRRPEYFYNLGGIFFREKAYPEAIQCYQAVLTLQPEDAEALCSLGAAYVATHKKQEGETLLRRAIALKPDYAIAHLQLGALLFSLKKEEEAQSAYEQALRIHPTLAEALWGLGNLQFQKKNYAEAEQYHRQALQYKPKAAEYHHSLAQALIESGNYEEATECCQRAIEIDPGCVSAHCSTGVIQLKLKNFAQAEESFRKTIEIRPDFREAKYNLGNLFREQFRYSEAIDCYNESIRPEADITDESSSYDPAANPLYLHALNNIGLCLLGKGDVEAAIACYREALLHDPEHAILHGNLAVMLLKSGKLVEGWKEMEWRWKVPTFTSKLRDFGRPTWKGEPLHGKKIFLHIEQGHGDVIHFARYIPLVAERGGHVILEAAPSLCRLLKGIPGLQQIVTTGDTLPEFDYQCALMSLPLALQTTLETIPASIPYLTAPEDEIAAAKKQWPGKGLRVGLAWSGNPIHYADAHRSMDLQQMAPLGEVSGVSLYSLQVGAKVQQLAEISSTFPLTDVCSKYKDFADTAAFIAGLDLVITVDTSVAHLAGALGIPVWILLSYEHTDWRWLLNRSDSPWYPTARLFRQSHPGDWATVIETVKAELQKVSL